MRAEQGYKITAGAARGGDHAAHQDADPEQPSNPTGAAYTRADLRALGAVLLRHPRVVVCTDDMYEKIWWADEPFCSSLAQAVPALYDRTVTINGCSKAYAMTGWRIGYCGGPREIVTAMATVQGQSTSNPCSISQKAAVAAHARRPGLRRTHDRRLPRAPRLRDRRPQCPAGRQRPARRRHVLRLRRRPRRDARARPRRRPGVHRLPALRGRCRGGAGSGFGAPGHVRISFATSREQLEKALRQIDRALRAGNPAGPGSPRG
jgi:aspartate aminotransferase